MKKAIKKYFISKRDEKELKKNRENVIEELPEFASKLVLLLNAGMVLTQAIEKIAGDREDSYFYRELSEIKRKMKETNTPFTDEFRDFARRTGVRELLRLSNIFTDNMDKGSELVTKLEQESAFMWNMSKKQVEERGRLAESKLTFPMALMLISLIIVTAAPAFMMF